MFDKETLKPGIVLGLTALVLALLLAVVNVATRDVIEERKQADITAALNKVIENAMFEKVMDENGVITYKATKDGNPAGYCVQLSSYGYSSTPLSMIVGVDGDYNIIDISVTTNEETPGLGSKASDSSYLDLFKGKTGELKVKKDGGEIDAITGATKSSRAIADGATRAIEAVKKVRGGNDE